MHEAPEGWNMYDQPDRSTIVDAHIARHKKKQRGNLFEKP